MKAILFACVVAVGSGTSSVIRHPPGGDLAGSNSQESSRRAEDRKGGVEENVEVAERERRRRSNARAYYEQALKHGEAGRYLEALSAFERSIELDPENADTHYGLGLTYFNLGRWGNAAAALEQAVHLEPKDADSYNLLGASYFQLHEYGKAVSAFERVLGLDPKRVDARYNIASALFNSRQSGAAATRYEEVIRARPKLADAHNDLGVALSAMGRPVAAAESFRQAVRLNPRDSYALNNLALVLEKQGRRDEAAEAMARARRLEPDDKVIELNSSLMAASTGKAALGQAVATSGPSVKAGEQGSMQAEQTTGGMQWLVRSNIIRDEDLKELSRADWKGNVPDFFGGTGPTPSIEGDPGVPPRGVNDTPGRTAAVGPRPDASVPTPQPVASPAPAAGTVSPTEIYRVGAGDVLDVRLSTVPSAASTLYTVAAGGLLDYPPAGESVAVAGLTVGEIEALLKAAVLRRAGAGDPPHITVGVREFASHMVLVSGLVNNPGEKVLRREAIPLYVVVADAQPRPEAGRIVLRSRSTGRTAEYDLADSSDSGVLVYPGDVVEVTVRPPRFYFIGGKVKLPGQKEFHAGLTLTQAVMAAGGELHSGKMAAYVTRQGEGEKLIVITYQIKDIVSGKGPDPEVRPGDRIEVVR